MLQSVVMEDKSQVLFKIKIYSLVLKTDKKFVEMQTSPEYQVSRTYVYVCMCVCVCVCVWREQSMKQQPSLCHDGFITFVQ